LLRFVRILISPKRIDYDVVVPPAAMDRIAGSVDTSLMGVSALSQAVSHHRVILVGETHFKNEVIAYFLDFLNRLPSGELVLALELPDG